MAAVPGALADPSTVVAEDVTFAGRDGDADQRLSRPPGEPATSRAARSS